MNSNKQVESLKKLLKLYVLRRLKEDVEKSIPPKEETILDIELTTFQVAFYVTNRSSITEQYTKRTEIFSQLNQKLMTSTDYHLY